MAEQSFLIKFFEAFYEATCKQRQRALVSRHRPDVSQTAEGDATFQLVESIAQDLRSVLDAQHAHVLSHGGDYALTLYREVQYAMVALADELFLSIPWSGHKLWEANILEQRVFNSHVAGDVIFEKIEQALRTKDPEREDINIVYLYILGLGFKGKFADDPEPIDSLKKRLFLLINHYHQRIQSAEYVLCPQAYEALLEEGQIKQLPNPRVWHGVLFFVVFAALLLSYSFWFEATSEIHAVAHKIIQISGVEKP